MPKIELGRKVRDMISGFEGILIGYTVWLYGCKRCAVAPMELHEGKPIENCWFDEDQLEEIKPAPTLFDQAQ